MSASEPFGVIADSRAWAGPGDHHRTIILAAFLFGSPKKRRKDASFGQRDHTMRSVFSAVDVFVIKSPGLCTASLHVVHDVPDLGDPLLYNRSVRDSTTYHGFAPRPDYLVAPDRRFLFYVHVLNRIEWDCAFAVDLTDVVVLTLPRCDALPPKLAIATGGGSPKMT